MIRVKKKIIKYFYFFKQKTREGFSLGLVLGLMAVISASAISISELFKGTSSNQRVSRQNYIVQDTMNFISLLLEQGGICKQNFNNKNLSGGSLTQVTGLGGSPIFLQTNQPIPGKFNENVYLESINWSDPTPIGTLVAVSGTPYSYETIQPTFTFTRGNPSIIDSLRGGKVIKKISITVLSNNPDNGQIFVCYPNFNSILSLDVVKRCNLGVSGLVFDTSTLKFSPKCVKY